MPELPAHLSSESRERLRTYEEFLEDIKRRIRTAQARAARAINAELIDVYWQIGQEILRRQAEEGPDLGRRTRGVVQRLSADLRTAFPGTRGYSVPSLYRMRALASAWPEGLSDRLRDLPWGSCRIDCDHCEAGGAAMVRRASWSLVTGAARGGDRDSAA